MGVLADAAGVEEWLASAIQSLALLPEIAISQLFLLPARQSSPEAAPPWFFRKLDTWSRSGTKSCFAVTRALPPSVQHQPLSGKEGVGLAPDDQTLIAALQLDVLLCATGSPLVGDCTNLARLGVFSLVAGEPGFTTYRPRYWREVFEGRPVSRAFLLLHNQRLERGRVIDSFATPTLLSLRFTLNQAAPFQGMSALLGRSLLKVAERGTAPPGGEEIELSSAPPRWPTLMETMVFCGQKLKRSATLRAQARGKVIRWFVGIRPASGAVDLQDPAQGKPFVEIPAPPGHFYADPFIVEHRSRHWLFVEDWIDRNGRACLTCLEIKPDLSVGEPVVILDQPYHLSYPQVFSHAGDFFMIPESKENSTVDLYRATRFPFEWKFETVLMKDEQVVDTTALHHDGTWYFFTCTMGPPEEAYLFTANRLDGPWQYHPANPICTDTRNLRGAGAIFSRQGALIRPAQDCSLGYGYALAFNEIRRLSPSEYEERQAGKMLPTWSPGLIGTHTFNFNSRYEVIDGAIWRTGE